MRNERLGILHQLLCKRLMAISRIKGDNYWEVSITLFPGNKIRYRMDNDTRLFYVYAKDSSMQFSPDFNREEVEGEVLAYKWHIGTLYQYWLKNRSYHDIKKRSC